MGKPTNRKLKTVKFNTVLVHQVQYTISTKTGETWLTHESSDDLSSDSNQNSKNLVHTPLMRVLDKCHHKVQMAQTQRSGKRKGYPT